MFAKNVAKLFDPTVAKLLALPWPSYWPYNFDQKTKNQHLKIIKKTYFIVFFEQQEKTTTTTPKQPPKKQ